MELTNTNRPFGLIIKLTQTVDPIRIDVLRSVTTKDLVTYKNLRTKVSSQCGSDHEPPCTSAVRSAQFDPLRVDQEKEPDL